MKEQILLWGASGHALVVINIIELLGQYNIIGLVDDINTYKTGTKFGGYPLIGGREQFEIHRRLGVKHANLAFGDCNARYRLGKYLEKRDFVLPPLAHPTAAIANSAQIGPGTVVDAMAVIKPHAKIGKNAIINSCSSIGHQCVVEDACHVSPGVFVGGGTVIGKKTWIGIGACVGDHLSIGSDCVIGAGAAVVSNIEDAVLAVGVPAKIKKNIRPAESLNTRS